MKLSIYMTTSEKQLKTAVLILGGVQTLSMLIYGIVRIVLETIANTPDWLAVSVKSHFSLRLFDNDISVGVIIAMNILFVLLLEGAVVFLLFLRPFFLRGFEKMQISVTVVEGIIATTSLLNMLGHSQELPLLLYFFLQLALAVSINAVYKLASDNEACSKSVIISEV